MEGGDFTHGCKEGRALLSLRLELNVQSVRSRFFTRWLTYCGPGATVGKED
jgi:hypothetical protein